MSEQQLCTRDLLVLDLIFDKNQCEKKVNDLKQTVNDEVDAKDDDEGNSDEVLTSKKLELEGVRLTEEGRLDEALAKFNESIETAQHRPSTFNNRAQLYRFLEKDDLAIADLSRSILLSKETHQLTKCRAFCQRGIIKRKLNDLDGAHDDFNESSKLGSKFARQQLIDLNPYAQLCNQMVTKLLADMK